MNRLTFLLIPVLLLTETLGTARYEVRYKLGALDTRVVTAEITWEESSWNGIPAYYSAATLQTVPFFRLFLGSDYFAETYFSQSELKPLYFDNPFQKKGKTGKYEYLWREDGEIESTSTLGDQTVFQTFPNDGRTVDFLSLVHFLRFLDLDTAEEPLPVHILVSGKSYPGELLHLGEDTEKFPDMPAEKILLRLTERGLMENGSGNEIYIWRSSGPDRNILGLETDLSTGSMYARIYTN
jgi:hypothetical protein